ncbi:hypothetical protein G3573_21495, partial [Caulobacter sp. 17J65-9]|nr:hypothetical protein [Caulobacter sp. 17J65-9]
MKLHSCLAAGFALALLLSPGGPARADALTLAQVTAAAERGDYDVLAAATADTALEA